MNTNVFLPEIDRSRCDGCGDCARSCPQGALEMQQAAPIFIHPEACTFCTACEELCPTGAIRCAFEIGWGDETDPTG